MIPLALITQKFEERFLNKYQHAILPSHKKALHAIRRCRKSHGPHMVAQCTDSNCRTKSYIPHSCGHRSCPHCQNHENSQWIENQLAKQLPAQYYLITFTLPQQMRPLVWRNQSSMYAAMFKTVAHVLKTFTLNDKKLCGEAGFTAVLHTNSRRLDFHPHIHVVIVGGSINKKNRSWKTREGKYLFPHKAMAKVFRAKLLNEIAGLGLSAPGNCPKKWVVDCKNVGNGDKALIYLGSYLYKGVIREKDILHYDDTTVTFRYKDAQDNRYKTRTVTGEFFLWLIMQHVLPNGFRKVRSYGFLHPCSKALIKLLQLILRFNPAKFIKKLRQRAKIRCPRCGATMTIVAHMIPSSNVPTAWVPD